MLVARSGRGAAALGAFEEPDGLELHAAPLFDGLLAPEVPFRDVLARLADARASLRQRGFVEIFEPALERLAEGGLLRRSYPLRAGRCYVAVVDAAHGARDPDLFVLDPTGAEVARDLRPGAEARVEFCPEREGSHVFEVRLFEGAGAVALGLHEGPAPRVSRAVAAAPPRSEPGRDTALDEAVASRVQRGYVEQERFVTNAALRPGEQGAHDVVVGPGCVLVVGVASRPDTDLDLHLFEAAGELLDADTAVEPVARVGACATGPRRARVAVRVYGSPSPYALVTLRAPAAVADVTTLRLDTATDAVRARGMLPGSTGEARLEQGATHTLEMHVPAGRCTALAAAGPGATDDVDVTLARADGSIVASDTGPAPYALVRRCSAPQSDERLVATIRRYRGEGPVRFVQLVDPSP
ncbi:MAG: hypothetical protein NZ898_11975 [Myxococcota bacterium]|nr:hypothetical protein [Myxococcota bacterium]